MNWPLFLLTGYLAIAANAILAPLLAWNDVRPDFLLLLLPVVSFLEGPNRSLIQAFVVGAAIDFSGAAPPGIYATGTVLALGIVRHITRHSLPETSLGWLLRAVVLMLLVLSFAVGWEALALGRAPDPRWLLSHVLAPAGWTLCCGAALWLCVRLLKRLLPERRTQWSDRSTGQTPFFLSR